MAAHAPVSEEVAGAIPFAVAIGYGMVIIIAAKIHLKILEGDSFRLLRVASCFLDLAD